MDQLHIEEKPFKVKRTTIAIFLGSIVLVTLLRCHSLHEPLETDEAIFSVLAHDWLNGGKPYTTVWDNKPIGAFWLYRVAIACFGYVEAAPKLMALAFMAAATACLALLLPKRPAWQALALLGMWPALACFPATYANGANLELFMLPLLLAAMAAMYRYRADNCFGWFVGAAVLLSLAALVKQVALPYFIAIVLLPTPAANGAPRQAHPARGYFLSILRRGLVAGVILFGLHVAAYALAGGDPLLFLDQYAQNAGYTTTDTYGTDNLVLRLLQAFVWTPFGRPVYTLWLPGLMAYAGAWICWQRRADPLPATFLAATVLAIALPGKGFPHYYILYLPFLLIGLVHGLAAMPRPRQTPRHYVWLAAIVLGLWVTAGLTVWIRDEGLPYATLLVLPLLIAGTVCGCWHLATRGRLGGPRTAIACGMVIAAGLWFGTYTGYLRHTPAKLSYHKYQSNMFNRDRDIGRRLVALGFSGQRCWVDGSHTSIYFYAGVQPATPYLVSWAYDAFGATTWAAEFERLQTAPPAVCVLQYRPPPALQQWLAAEYNHLERYRAANIYRKKPVSVKDGQ